MWRTSAERHTLVNSNWFQQGHLELVFVAEQNRPRLASSDALGEQIIRSTPIFSSRVGLGERLRECTQGSRPLFEAFYWFKIERGLIDPESLLSGSPDSFLGAKYSWLSVQRVARPCRKAPLSAQIAAWNLSPPVLRGRVRCSGNESASEVLHPAPTPTSLCLATAGSNYRGSV